MHWDVGNDLHEGRLGAVVPDGRLSYEIGGMGVLVEGVSGKYPRDAVQRDHEIVDDDDVVGWRSTCRCGWLGPLWSRVASKDEERLKERRAFVPYLGFATPPLSAEVQMKEEWYHHAHERIALEQLRFAQNVLLTAELRLAEAVANSRATGLSWGSIASALGVSRQSAHARWRNSE
ncbi:hypothetical protein PJL15_03954 [Paenarthrobacter nitroguajacolicus]|nr:hypothetical protein [Paenarthrobacter nitroguajacolicus]